MNALELQNVTKEYPGFSLADISFSLPSGYIMGLIGENGADKSTTIKCILDLVRRDSGEVRVLGHDMDREARTLKGEIGVVLDESGYYNSFTPAQVDRIQSGLYPRWDSALFQQYLNKFGLTEKKTVKEFSKGMRMKLALAAAFLDMRLKKALPSIFGGVLIAGFLITGLTYGFTSIF